jgi:D-alanyl-lipoteichoic acid acyltransferase DltB (MBOAT superfamily)
MLFHTAGFLLAFLPLTLVAYFILGRLSLRAAMGALALSSLVFYGWWSPIYVPLLLGSIVLNFAAGSAIRRCQGRQNPGLARLVAGMAIGFDLLLLCYCKYLMFFAAEANGLLGTHWDVGRIVLPIGISFYTFTQIAYVVDTLQRKVSESSFLAYLLFVTYFPHLVAGPVLHHAEMMPQFRSTQSLALNPINLASGLTLLTIGLFKKVVLADGCAPMAGSVFGAADVSAAAAWIGAVAYSLQIYFDFSGYSDMAVGISLLFNIRLPVNFHSPYRATNIVDFWRCWHMTLSRFLRDYLYVPLGGNRKGSVRRYSNLLVTMLLGGLWHGASWNFAVWGTLHGVFLVVNHLWRALPDWHRPSVPAWMLRGSSWLLTLLAVIVAWVFFRADTMHNALTMLQAMAGLASGTAPDVGVVTWKNLSFLLGLSAIVLFAPNSSQIMKYDFGLGANVSLGSSSWTWRPSVPMAVTLGLLAFVTLAIGLAGRTRLEFLYFQF